MNITTQPESPPSDKVQSNISSRIPAQTYTKLTDVEGIVLHMLDSLAPNSESVTWPCNYDELMRMAEQSPAIDGGQVMSAITRLMEFKILHCFMALDGDRFDIWVAPWGHRYKLAHEINTQLIARRSVAPCTSSSTGEPTQAA